jgi:hypothetical protein
MVMAGGAASTGSGAMQQAASRQLQTQLRARITLARFPS